MSIPSRGFALETGLINNDDPYPDKVDDREYTTCPECGHYSLTIKPNGKIYCEHCMYDVDTWEVE